MTKKKSNTVMVEIGQSLVEVDGDAMLCIVKMSHVAGVKTGDPWPHVGPTVICDRAYKLTPLSLEAGATLVRARDWADHVEAKSPGLMHLLAAGEVTVYASAAEALAKIGPAQLRAIIKVTRVGLVLREWLEIERAQARPRRPLVDGLRERLRLYVDHAPAQYLSLGDMRVSKGSRARSEAVA